MKTTLLPKLSYLVLSLFVALLWSCAGGLAEDDGLKKLDENEADILKYVADKKLNPSQTSSGLRYVLQTLNLTGKRPALGDEVQMHYQISMLDGTLYDSTNRAKNAPYVFTYGVNSLPAGFLEAMTILRSGEKGLFLMNHALAFGNQSDNVLKPYSAIAATLQLVKVRTEEQQIDDYIVDKKLALTEKTASGLRFVRTLTNAAEAAVAAGQTVKVKYSGRFLNDKVFDSGEFSVAVGGGRVIKGFDEGISKMRFGEKATILFPSSLGYGTAGSGTIAPYAPLIFDIEVVK